MLKPLDQVMQPDRRYQSMVIIDPERPGGTRPMTLADHHQAVASFEIGPAVPADVSAQFDKARNIFIYAWFDYDLIPVAAGLAFGAIELALSMKAVADGLIKIKRPPGLAELLQIAIERDWIRDDRFPSFVRKRARRFEGEMPEMPKPHADPQAFCRTLATTIPYLRNEFAHGRYYVYPPGAALSGLELAAEIISQLYVSGRAHNKDTATWASSEGEAS
jgi:hypothetical protein